MLSVKKGYINLFMIKLLILFALSLLPLFDYANPNNSPPNLSKVKLQLKYYHQFQFAGYYAALHKGYYRNAGLDVEIIEGGTINSIEKVVSGQADYGIAANDILIERINNQPIVLLACIFQTSPSIFLSLKKSNIHTAHDLIGKKIMLLENYRDPELMAIFHQEGIQINDIHRISTTYDIKDLTSGRTDALNAYITNEPFFLKEQNIPYTIISPKTYGIDFYGDGIFTSENEIKSNPDRVKVFLEASKKGWEYALANQDEIIDVIISKYSNKKSRAHLEFEAEQIKKLILNEYVEIGHINPGRIQNIADICAKMGMIPLNYDLTGFIYKPESYHTPAWLKWLLAIAMGIIIIVIGISSYLYLFNKQLRKAVAKQTSNLSSKNSELQVEIGERIKTVAALKQSEKRFREMVENLPSGAILNESNKLFINNKAHQITGYTNEELADIDTWFLKLYPKSKKNNLQRYLENKNNNFDKVVTSCITDKNGIEKHVEFHCYQFDNKEIWLMNDITQRLKTENALIASENKLRAYIDESPNGLVIFTPNTKVTYSNSAFNKLMEIPKSRLNEIFIPDFFAPRYLEQNQKLLTQLLTKGKCQGEVIIQSFKGKQIPIFISAVKLINNEYLGFIVDISAIKKAEKELRIALEKVEESDRLKSAFLANMSHEIRTPMNGILGFSQLLLKPDLNQEKKEKYLDIINQNGKQLLDIINNIIDISYLEVNQLKTIPSTFSIKKLFDDLNTFFSLDENRFNKKDIEIRFENKVPENSDKLTTDLGKIKQILINLINNALKFTKHGYIRICSRIENSNLYLSVEDSGIGIPKEKQKLIFERFGQVENTYTRQFGGAGLGLPISKGLIELLGGELHLESNEGKGAKFEFYIPLTKEALSTKIDETDEQH